MCCAKQISLITVKSYGLIGSVRLQLNGHSIIESKTEGDAFDLRIAEPFPELAQYCENIHLEDLDSLQHGHVPYIAILYKAVNHWRSEVTLFAIYSMEVVYCYHFIKDVSICGSRVVCLVVSFSISFRTF